MADEYRLVPMPNGGFQRVASRQARFWAKVDRRGDNECWLWRGFVGRSGYGLLRDGKNMRPATHVALELDEQARPPAPNNHALHGDDCVSRACCNPNHLRWGSNRDNVADRERLGRNKLPHVYGARQGSAKLTDADVLEIRSCGGTQRDVAARFGVGQMTISLIRQGKTWRHLL